MSETKIIQFANSVDPDEVAHHEPPHLDLYCLPLSLSSQNDINWTNHFFLNFARRKFCCLLIGTIKFNALFNSI